MDRRIFVAGSTGATGRTLQGLREAGRTELILHERPKPGRTPGPRTAVFELSDEDALKDALDRSTTVVQLIGTMRKRFAKGDTYETSDIGTTRLLIDGAKGTPVDHIVLLSSVGAGRPLGAYLKAKRRAEQIVEESGIPFTIFRPSAFEGGGHHAPPGTDTVARLLRLSRFRPILIEDLARTILYVARSRTHTNEILEGDALWRAVEEAKADATSG